MNKLSNGTLEKQNQEYIPVEVFKTMFAKGNPFPYENKFSLRPLLDEWKNQYTKGDPGYQTLLSLEELASRIETVPVEELTMDEQPELGKRLATVFPSFFFKNQMGFIAVPFSKQFLYQSSTMEQLMNSKSIEIKAPELASKVFTVDKKIFEAGYIILKTFYKKEFDLPFHEILHLRDTGTHLEKHYKFNVVLDYVKAKALKPVKKLSEKQFQHLLDNINDAELWKKTFPVENFAFEGFVLGFLSDVTNLEIISQIRAQMIQEEAAEGMSTSGMRLSFLQQQVRSFLKMPEIGLGCLQTTLGAWQERTNWSILRSLPAPMETEAIHQAEKSYARVLETAKPVIINDLSQLPSSSDLEQALVGQGIKSLLLAPLFDSKGKIIGIFELTSNNPFQFSHLTLIQLKEVIALFNTGMERGLNEVSKLIDIIIKQQFTSIHPSVEWKFSEVAGQYLFQQQIEIPNNQLAPIIFKNLYPIYGQADIISSSKLRNKSIEADLIDNLERLEDVIAASIDAVSFHLLDIYQVKVHSTLERLKKGEFVSSDESQIVDLLTREIHPLLRQMMERYPQLPMEQLQDYFNYLDPELNIVYQKRKDYEESVSMLNTVIGGYLDREDQKMQNILPHFYEKYSTDGIEYNIYIGQDILQSGRFSDFYLRDFRLWQLINMCEITRLVKKKSKFFPVRLTTAQLIFVYNNPLSIRFRMDEKQFDVDGAYNVRYEILKKRIDKAIVKGSDDRLTQKDKIAIVWLQEKDRLEYLEYLEHLIIKDYITEEIEELELEKLQGAEGLKALRVTVKYK